MENEDVDSDVMKDFFETNSYQKDGADYTVAATAEELDAETDEDGDPIED